VEYHLDYRTLMAQRSALECRRLILTHVSADLLARLAEVEIEYAEDSQRIIV
jgi:hypothetical protein